MAQRKVESETVDRNGLLSAERFEVVLSSISDGVFTVDTDGRIACFNRAAESITGYTRQEVMGRPCREVLRANICREACALRYTRETGNPIVDLDVTIEAKDGETVPVSISTALLRNRDGIVIGAVETFRDRRLVQQLRKVIEKSYGVDDIVGKSPKMRDLHAKLRGARHDPDRQGPRARPQSGGRPPVGLLAPEARPRRAGQATPSHQPGRRRPVTVRSFEGKTPIIGKGTYVHPSADVFGDVTIGEECWIGPGARIRGDYGTILIGSRSSVEDNCVIHARPGETTRIGDRHRVRPQQGGHPSGSEASSRFRSSRPRRVRSGTGSRRPVWRARSCRSGSSWPGRRSRRILTTTEGLGVAGWTGWTTKGGLPR